jgi:hypothetical protein
MGAAVTFEDSFYIGKRFREIEARLDQLEKPKIKFSDRQIKNLRETNLILDWLMEPQYTFWLGAGK